LGEKDRKIFQARSGRWNSCVKGQRARQHAYAEVAAGLGKCERARMQLPY
jgi:hypothetical protein